MRNFVQYGHGLVTKEGVDEFTVHGDVVSIMNERSVFKEEDIGQQLPMMIDKVFQ